MSTFDASIIQKIPMSRWLAISRRYGVTLADLGNAEQYATELSIITANEALRRRYADNRDHWDEVEALDLEGLADVLGRSDDEVVDQAAAEQISAELAEADKSGRAVGAQ